MTKLIHQSGGSNIWGTPHFLYDHYNELYGFKLDAAASDDNHLCDKYYTEETNALVQEWEVSNWLNCPYSPNTLQKQFIHKAVTEACKDRTTVCLIPSRTETKIWQEFVFPLASDIIFIDERIHFSYCANGAGFPSAIVVFDCEANRRFTQRKGVPGRVTTLQLRYLEGYKEYKAKVEVNKKIWDAEKKLNQDRLDHGVFS